MTKAAPPRRHGDFTLAGFLAAAIVAAAFVGATYWLFTQQTLAQRWISHTHEVRAIIASARADLVDIQAGSRGFVLTGNEEDLQPYESAREDIRRDLRSLAEATGDNPLQQQRLQRLQEQLETRLAQAAQVVQVRRAQGFASAKALIDTREAARLTTAMRAELEQMEVTESQLLAQRLAGHDQRVAMFWVGVTAVLASLCAALLLLYRQVRRSQDAEHQLLQSEQRFHLMTDSVTEHAILMLDADGRVRSWNQAARRIHGYDEPDIVGRHIACFYPEEDVRAGRPQRALELAAQQGHYVEEGWRIRKDGSRFWASVATTPLREGGRVTGYCKITRDLTERRQADEALQHEMQERIRIDEELQQLNARLESLIEARTAELQQANTELSGAKERLQELSARLIMAQEEERRHIARELHDETGQALTLIRLQLTDLARRHPEEDRDLTECMHVVDRAVAHIRGLSLRLRPPMLDDLGLVDALEWVLGQQAKAAGWRPELEADEIEDRPSEAIETACFRIGQEALTNAARYARATEVKVELRLRECGLELTVSDNGRGFDLALYRTPEERKKHFGLVSMTERASLAGGRLEIDTAPGRGTRIRAWFPLGSGRQAQPADRAVPA